MKPELQPTFEETAEKEGHGFLQLGLIVSEGKLAGEPFEIRFGLDCNFYVHYKGRVVKYDAKKMVEEAAKLIEKAKQKR